LHGSNCCSLVIGLSAMRDRTLASPSLQIVDQQGLFTATLKVLDADTRAAMVALLFLMK
jgi:hypothetical protein